MEQHDKDNEREPAESYESPKLVRVSLRPEEAVLGHCKVTGASGLASAGCGARPPIIVCRVIGS